MAFSTTLRCLYSNSLKKHALLKRGLMRFTSTCDIHSKNSTANESSLKKSCQRNLGQPSAFTHPYLMENDDVTPGLTKDEFRLRRQKLIDTIMEIDEENKSHVIIFLGEGTRYMTEDIPYPFHQNNNFLYLTGFMEPDSCLIMELNENKEVKTTLLVPPRDAHKEKWHGSQAGMDGAQYLTGIENTGEITDLPKLLPKFLSKEYKIWFDYHKLVNYDLFTRHMRPFLSKAFSDKLSVQGVDTKIYKQRLIKSKAEIKLIAEACELSAEAFARVISATSAGMNERSIHALLECECKLRGGQMLAYPPVVAGGSRANTLHYIFNNQRVEDGELVLVDAGAEYHGYCADITRTWPVNGKFSKQQRTIYDIVLRVQRACIALCTPKSTLDEIYGFMLIALAKEMIDNKIFKTKPSREQVVNLVRTYCPHHVGHWLGMDVHDTSPVPRSTPFEHGMVVTIEPGLYFEEGDVNVHEEYHGIGIRIEDDILITHTDPIVLTVACPKDPDDIEKMMAES